MTPKKTNSSLPKSFLIFILVSLFFWFLTKLSKQYENSVELKVSYENLPIDKVVKNDLPATINVGVKASGFKLFYANLVSPSITVNCSNLESIINSSFWLNLQNQKNEIQSQLSNGMVISYFNPAKIKVDFDQLESKKVKINPRLSLDFKDNFDAYEKSVIQPDSIVVSGPKSILDSIKKLDTELLVLENVESDVSEKLSIHKKYKGLGVVFKEMEVQFTMKVDKFTEGSIQVPFTVLNMPLDKNISTFPNEVKITYKVGLNDYNRVNKDLFKVQCDFNEAVENSLNFLIPKMIASPPFVKDIHLNTKKIDFFITK